MLHGKAQALRIVNNLSCTEDVAEDVHQGLHRESQFRHLEPLEGKTWTATTSIARLSSTLSVDPSHSHQRWNWFEDKINSIPVLQYWCWRSMERKSTYRIQRNAGTWGRLTALAASSHSSQGCKGLRLNGHRL